MIPNTHVTIYNKYIDPTTRTEKYKRSEIFNCVWQSSRSVSRMKEQMLSNTALVLIPFASGSGYVEPKAWQALTVKTGYWTLQEGDTIARGLITAEIGTLYSLADLRNDHEYVFVIASIASMDEGSPNVQHWEVQAR